MGAFITWTVIKSMDGLGAARATLLIVVTQILVSYVVEVFGMFGVERAGFGVEKASGSRCCHCRDHCVPLVRAERKFSKIRLVFGRWFG